MKVNYHIFEPSSPALSDTLITMGNTLGNSLRGNGGDKARFLARLLNMRVCAYERPGTGSEPFGRSVGYGEFVAQSHDVAGYLNDELRQEGMNTTIVTAHSADSPFALSMVTSNFLPSVAYAASDPVGVRNISTIGGFRRWQRYEREKKLSGHPSPNTPPEWKAPPEMSNQQLVKDMYRHHRVWRERRVIEGLGFIAQRQPDVAVRVLFPEYSFNGDPAFMQQTATLVHALGATRGGLSAPFYGLYEPGRAHRHYDDPRYFGGLVVDTLINLGHKPLEFVHPMYQALTFRHGGTAAA